MAQKVPNPKLMDMVCDVLWAYNEPMTFSDIKQVLEIQYGPAVIADIAGDLAITLQVDLVEAGCVRLAGHNACGAVYYEAIQEVINDGSKQQAI